MGGVAKAVGGAVGTVLTLGTNKIKGSPTGKLGDAFGNIVTGGTSGQSGLIPKWGPNKGGGGSSGAAQAGMPDNPAETLAHTGGAPLLANVALGADPKAAIAGYFGHGDWDTFYSSLNDSDKGIVDGINNQLTAIQKNTDLRNQAVQSVVNDFPNIMTQAAQARQASGAEFDDVTKGYITQALNGTASKFAAGGNISSGAMNEATAKVGAQMGQSKLSYMDQRGDQAYSQGVLGWTAKYNEANALRTFQQSMMNLSVQKGNLASQNALDRTQKTDLTNAKFANDLNLADQGQQQAMLGAIGKFGSSVSTGYTLNQKSNLFGSTTPSNTKEADGYNSNLG